MDRIRQLAPVQQANGYRLGDALILVIAGEMSSPCYTPDIEELPMEIHPPQFAANLLMNPLAICPEVETPYQCAEAFRVGGDFEQVTLHTAGGNMEVPIQLLEEQGGADAPAAAAAATTAAATDPRAVLGQPAEAVGYSNNWDFGEAMKDAISKLPPRGANIPDWLSTYHVVDIGAEVGGIAGWNRLSVRVRG